MPGRLRDVASRAGVALSTASLALKGGPHVSAHVRGRVIEAARALHYDVRRLGATAAPPFPDAASQPDHLTAVLLVPARFHAVYNTYFAPLVAAVRAAARELGFELFLAPTEGGPPDAPLHTILADVHNPVDGILLMGVSDGPADLAWLAGWGKPAVLLSRHLEGAAARLCSSVGIDYEAAIRLPVDHLVALGHRAIAYAGLGGEGRDSWSSTLQRLHGFKAALQGHGLVPDHIFPVAQDQPAVWEEIAGLVSAMQVTAVVCANDTVAIEGRARLLERGLQAPADYAITGLDDVDEAAATGLTSVTSERERVGRLGVELLEALVTDPVMARQHTVLRPRLVVRGSTQRSAQESTQVSQGSTQRSTPSEEMP